MATMYETEKMAGITMVYAAGRLVCGNGDRVLRDTMENLISRGETRVVLDLGNVREMDSAGLGELVRSFSSLRQAGGTLKLLHLPRRAHHLLHVTRLRPVFEVYGSERAAVDSFAPNVLCRN